MGDELQKIKKEHLFDNEIHGIIESVDKIIILKWKTKFQFNLKCKSKFYIGRNYLCTYLNSIDCQ